MRTWSVRTCSIVLTTRPRFRDFAVRSTPGASYRMDRPRECGASQVVDVRGRSRGAFSSSRRAAEATRPGRSFGHWKGGAPCGMNNGRREATGNRRILPAQPLGQVPGGRPPSTQAGRRCTLSESVTFQACHCSTTWTPSLSRARAPGGLGIQATGCESLHCRSEFSVPSARARAARRRIRRATIPRERKGARRAGSGSQPQAKPMAARHPGTVAAAPVVQPGGP